MKKAFGTFLVAVLLVTMLWLPLDVSAYQVASGTYRDQVTWSLDDSGTLIISGTGYVDRSMGQLPWIRDVQKVVVEEGITALGENAFNGYVNMTSVTLPDTLTEIGGYAFKKCEKLERIDIPEGVRYIGGSAFEDCTLLREINIPNGVTAIWGGTFQNCSSLERIDIPADVTQIEGRAFKGCSSLERIDIPAGVPEIAEETFSGCISLRIVSIPNGVTRIASQAFAGCTGLKTVCCPVTVQELALDSFADCGNLRRVMYGGSRSEFFDLVYAALKNNMEPEAHSLYTVRLFPRCVVTGVYHLDVALAVMARVIRFLMIPCAGGLIVLIIVNIKRRSERIL